MHDEIGNWRMVSRWGGMMGVMMMMMLEGGWWCVDDCGVVRGWERRCEVGNAW
jgi:hypothetical protein